MIADYDIYHLSLRENLVCLCEGLTVCTVLGFLFYHSIFGVIFLVPFLLFYRKFRTKALIKKRKWELNLEFKDAITALSAALEAGYSAENAFEQAADDLHRIYKEDALILREFSYIINQLKMNISVERALLEFGERSGIEDILSFSEVFHTAKRTGGDLIHVIKITSNVIGDKIEVKREILTLITAKRLEADIMKLTPLIILLYLSVSSPGFLDPLYGNLIGIIIMTLFLVAYLAAILVIDKLIAIEV